MSDEENRSDPGSAENAPDAEASGGGPPEGDDDGMERQATFQDALEQRNDGGAEAIDVGAEALNRKMDVELDINKVTEVDDDDEMAVIEPWRPGDFACLLADAEAVQKAWETKGTDMEYDSRIVNYCGQVAVVNNVVVEQPTLDIIFDDDTKFTVPTAAVRKTHKVFLRSAKTAGTSTAEYGLHVRASEYGGLQVLGTRQKSDAWEEGLSALYGMWLTHVGETRVMNPQEFKDAVGTTMRFDKRIDLPYTFARDTLESKIERAILGADLRMYLLFAVFFVITFLLDRDVAGSYYLVANMRDSVLGNEIPTLWTDSSGIGCGGGVPQPYRYEKLFEDLAHVGDWNVWVYTMALPSIWQDNQFGRSVGSNILLGGVRFRTLRMQPDSCGVNKDIIPPYLNTDLQKCYAPYSSSGESEGKPGQDDPAYLTVFNPSQNISEHWGETPQYRECSEMNPGGWSPHLFTGQITYYHCGGYTFEIPFWRNRTDGLERISGEEAQATYKNWACQGWVDNIATRLVGMEFMEYSPTYDQFLSTRIYYEVAAGGAWIPTTQYRTFHIWSASKVQSFTLDIIFGLMVLYYCKDFVGDARRQAKRRRPLLQHFLQPWVLMEFVNLSLFITSYVFRIAWYVKSGEAGVKIEDLVLSGSYPSTLDQIVFLYQMTIYINSCNIVLTFLKLLKYLKLNARMHVLTATLADCQESTVGVLVIFFLVVLAFSVAGNNLYGTQIYGFRDLSSSISTLMRQLMGEFDYAEMKRENRQLAPVFFWTYIVLGLFILLNFLIGVISESFANVSRRTHPEPMDKLLQKLWYDVKMLCRTNMIKTYCHTRLCRRKNREEQLELCVDAIDEFKTSVSVAQIDMPGEQDDEDDDKEMEQSGMITKREFIGAIAKAHDGDLVEGLGMSYIIFIWNHVYYEFHRSHDSEMMREILERQAAFQRGCSTALADKLKILEQFSKRVEALDRMLLGMKDILDEER
eukprot:TRINITY_DN19285_c0_g1_i1.p1 TRINITY_DN19285_c0_g1~~TRINITY_DN19285_c0_g1_i1.p1  ORF type:complete len:971 (+),score=390.52 TRINITY_DN19285_c0_g1_i1:81-2993(+)